MIAGGAILDEAEQMIGSTMFVEFDSKADLDQWLASDPYVTGNVWQEISVLPYSLGSQITYSPGLEPLKLETNCRIGAEAFPIGVVIVLLGHESPNRRHRRHQG